MEETAKESAPRAQTASRENSGQGSGQSSSYEKRNDDRRNDRGRSRDSRGKLSFGRKLLYRKKECYFTKNHIEYLDYKNTDQLIPFLGKGGKILSPHFTGVKPKYQRRLAKAIKRARYMALIPFTGNIQFNSEPREEGSFAAGNNQEVDVNVSANDSDNQTFNKEGREGGAESKATQASQPASGSAASEEITTEIKN